MAPRKIFWGEVKNVKDRESSVIASKAVGMNHETYQQAKAVVKSGDEEAIKAMDSREKSRRKS